MDSDLETLTAQLRSLIEKRRQTLSDLRERIVEMVCDIPIGVCLSDDGGIVCNVVRVYTGASQWSNRTWVVTLKGRAYLTITDQMIAVNCKQWMTDDRGNMHTRSTEPYLRSLSNFEDEPEEPKGLEWASGSETRKLAVRLPAAIARYMAECEAEAQANATTLTTEDVE